MRRRSIALASGLVLALSIVTTATLLAMLWHEPAFYRRQAVPAGPAREQRCCEFKAEFSQFLEGIVNQPKEGWYARFTDLQINSYLEEAGQRENVLQLPQGISDPRVAIEAERLRIGFRYGAGWLSSVVSLDLRLWLAPREPNVVAVEVRGLRRGALPVSTQLLLERISDVARRQGLEVTWFRHEGLPVALVRMQPEPSQRGVRLQRLDLLPATILLSGISNGAGASANAPRNEDTAATPPP